MEILPDFQAFIFDMDGVLIDSENFYTEMEQQNFSQLGIEIPHLEHITYQGTATDQMWRTIKQKYNLIRSIDELVEMTNELTIPVFQRMEKMPVMEGVTALLEFLHDKNISMALASSSFPEVIEIVLDKTGFRKYFSVVVNSRMAGASKPLPDIFLMTANRLGVEPEKCIVIEDSTNGIAAAKAAGMYCIAFNGPGAEHQNQQKADIIISNFSSVSQLLNEKGLF